MLRFRAVTALSLAVLAAAPSGAAAAARADGSRSMSPTVARVLARVPASALDAAGADRVSEPANFPRRALTGPRLRRGGRPEIVVADLSWCAYCAANSWALVVALQRFGSFGRLGVVDTGTYAGAVLGENPAYSHTRGVSFFGATYRSRYVSFRPLTVQDRAGRPLEQRTAADRRALAFAHNAFPAVNIAGLFGTTGSGYSPGFLAGRSALEIARSLSRPGSAVGSRVDGLANFFAAGICRATGGRPARVCAAPGVQAGAGKLP